MFNCVMAFQGKGKTCYFLTCDVVAAFSELFFISSFTFTLKNPILFPLMNIETRESFSIVLRFQEESALYCYLKAKEL